MESIVMMIKTHYRNTKTESLWLLKLMYVFIHLSVYTPASYNLFVTLQRLFAFHLFFQNNISSLLSLVGFMCLNKRQWENLSLG